jgi:hypothetical protein
MVALIDWESYGKHFPTVTDYLRRVDGRDEAIGEGVEVVRTRPVVDGKGTTLLPANQRGTVIRLESRVGVAVLFDPPSSDLKLSDCLPSSANAIWMSQGIRPLVVELDDLLGPDSAHKTTKHGRFVFRLPLGYQWDL